VIALLPFFDFEGMARVILEHELIAVFTALEVMLTQMNKERERTGLVTNLLIYAIKLERQWIALHVVLNYDSILKQEADCIMDAVLRKLRDTSLKHMEYLMNLMLMLVSEARFHHAEEFVNILETAGETDKSHIFNVDTIISWSNPIMVLVLTVDVL